MIYAVTYQGRLGALSRGTGRSLWFQDSSSHHAPAYSQEQVYVTEDEDAVRAFKAGSGQSIGPMTSLFLRQLTGPANWPVLLPWPMQKVIYIFWTQSMVTL